MSHILEDIKNSSSPSDELWMSPSKASASSDFVLICGQDDHATRQRSKQVYERWISDCPDHEQEIVDGSAATVSEASQALSRCLEALQTLSFFGAGKLIWFRHCTFLGEEKMAASKAVTEGLAAVVQEVQQVGEGSFRLLISAGKVDKRKSFYKQFQKLGKVEVHDGWDPSKSDWVIEAEQRVGTLLLKPRSRQTLKPSPCWSNWWGLIPGSLNRNLKRWCSLPRPRGRPLLKIFGKWFLGTNRPRHLRWEMPWEIEIWRQPCAVWMRALGNTTGSAAKRHRFVVWSDLQGAHLDFGQGDAGQGVAAIGKAIFSFQTATGANTSR